MPVFLIIPAYNEEKRIGKTLGDYLGFFGHGVEILIVANGCTDRTVSVVKEWQKRYPRRLSLISYAQTKGKGWAVRKGFERALASFSCDLVGFVDADDATGAEEFGKLISALQGGDGAIASRFLPRSKIDDRDSQRRKAASLIFRTVVRLLFRLPFSDTQCGAKVFRKGVVENVLPHMSVDDMAFDVELLYWCRRFGYRIREVPTVWRETKVSSMTTSATVFARTSFFMLRSLAWMRVRFWFERTGKVKKQKKG